MDNKGTKNKTNESYSPKEIVLSGYEAICFV